jgi:hypothetical protein
MMVVIFAIPSSGAEKNVSPTLPSEEQYPDGDLTGQEKNTLGIMVPE